MPQYLSIKEASEYLGISTHTLYKLVEREQLPAAKVGGSWRLNSEALDDFLGGQRRPRSKSPEILIVDSDLKSRRELASMAMSRGARIQLATGVEDTEVLLTAGMKPDLILYAIPRELDQAFDFMSRVRATRSNCRVAAVVPPERAADLADLMSYGWLIVLPVPVERPEMVNLIASL